MIWIAIVITIIGCLVWWWLIQQSLQFYRLRLSTVWVLIALSICSVLVIISFPHLYYSIVDQVRNHPLHHQSARIYLAYIALASLLLSVIVFYRSGHRFLIQQVVVLTVVAIISVLLPSVGLYSLHYYLLAAGVEEYVKYYVGLGSWSLYGVLSSDFLLFALMSGLGFACIENLVYVVTGGESVAVVTSITRLIVGPLVHMLLSGGLAYLYLYLRDRGFNYSALILATVVVVLVHSGYNASVASWGWMGIVLFCVLGYAGISYFLYSCDRLYFVAVQGSTTSAGK